MANGKGDTTGQPTAGAETVQPVAPVVDEGALKARINELVAKGEYIEAAKIAKQLADIQTSKQSAEREAKQKALLDITERVKVAIAKATEPLLKEIEAKGGDGIWYVSDWGEALIDVRLMKKAPSKAKGTSGGGGAGKKFAVTTEDMLTRHGHEEYKDGQTYQQAYDSNTGGNARYAIRVKLLKLDGQV